MAHFVDLLNIISSQGPPNSSPADVLAELGSPSTSIAILDHGVITSHCISSIGDNEETVFQACSISKPITGVAAMRLVQHGKLNLSDKIVNLLPPDVIALIETPQTKCLLPQITVKHLMSHTSGLSVSGFPGYAQHPPSVTTILSGRAPSNTPQVRLESLPGQTYAYSGGGMTVLQCVLEAVTGQALPQLVRQLVFEPLGMARSFYALRDDDAAHSNHNNHNVAPAYYTGHAPCEEPWRFQPQAAAAGLWTTPTDLLKVVGAVQKSLRGDNEAFLARDGAEEMLTAVLGTMALTWFAPRHPGALFGHGGANAPSFRAFVLGYADLEALLPGGDAKGGEDPKGRAGGEEGQNDEEEGLFEFEKIYYRKNRALMEDCGICVMTNSSLGRELIPKILHCISFVKHWVQVPAYSFEYLDARVPFVAGEDTVEEWKEWRGAWGEQWVLESDTDGRPAVRYGKETLVKLLPAAIPSMEYEEGRSVDLVLEGLEMMMRLGWAKGKRVVELWQGAVGKMIVLERKTEENAANQV